MSCCDDRKVNTQILESMNLISEKLSCVCNQIVNLFQNFFVEHCEYENCVLLLFRFFCGLWSLCVLCFGNTT